MRRTLWSTLLAFVMLAVIALPAPAVSAGQGEPRGKSHDEIVSYWTPERVAKAKPRELLVDERGQIVRTPQAGRAASGGSSTGASWTGGGLVQKTVGKVLFTMAGSDYVCSGTVVKDPSTNDRSLVLTAGHCVFDSIDGWASNWMFMPAFEDAPSTYNGSFNCAILTYGCWTTNLLVTSAGWAGGNFNEDYGFAIFGNGGKSGGLIEVAVGSQEIAFASTRPASVTAFGYPHASPYDGSDLVYCAGSTVVDTWGGSTSAGLKCGMTGGSSGGGWFAPFTKTTGVGALVSVNSFKYTAGPLKGYMFGPRLDADAQRTYNAAVTTTAVIAVP